jgi:hypothetical protein
MAFGKSGRGLGHSERASCNVAWGFLHRELRVQGESGGLGQHAAQFFEIKTKERQRAAALEGISLKRILPNNIGRVKRKSTRPAAFSAGICAYHPERFDFVSVRATGRRAK